MTKETQAWIKELEENARNAPKFMRFKTGDLRKGRFDYGHLDESYLIKYNSGHELIDIGGVELTIEQLEALISHMKQYSKVKE